MNKAKGILLQLAEGQAAAGLDGATLSKELRDALLQGAKALEFRQRVTSALNQTALSAASAETPKNTPESANAAPEQKQGARPNAMPRRWSAEEDAQLRKEFEADKLAVEEIAKLHSRSVYAIAVRLKNQHKLMTDEEVEAVRARQVAASAGAPAAPAPAPAPVSAPKPVSEAPAAAPAVPVANPPASAAPASPAAAPIAASEPKNDMRSDYDDSGQSSAAPVSADDIPWGDESSSGNFEMSESGAVNPPAPSPAPAPHPVVAATPERDGPDYEALFEMELSMATDAAREYVKVVQARLDAQPHIARGALNLLGGERAKAVLPNALRLAYMQKIETQYKLASAT